MTKGTFLGSFLLQQKFTEQKLMFDKMMGVKLVSGVFTNDSGKKFERSLLFCRDYSRANMMFY